MPPKQRPNSLKRVMGNPGRRPLNENEPIVDAPLGGPPKTLSQKQRAIWLELASNAPAGILTVADRTLMEVLTRLVFIMRHESDRFNAATASQIRTALACMAMEPSARSKFIVPKPDKEDPAAKYFN